MVQVEFIDHQGQIDTATFMTEHESVLHIAQTTHRVLRAWNLGYLIPAHVFQAKVDAARAADTLARIAPPEDVASQVTWYNGIAYYATVEAHPVLLGRVDLALAQREQDRARGGFAAMVMDSDARMRREG